jgi:hypothetical protein
MSGWATSEGGSGRPGLPALVVVSGPMGSGKTTLAHRIGQAMGCPAICRDEIKEGMVWRSRPGDWPPGGDPGALASGLTMSLWPMR